MIIRLVFPQCKLRHLPLIPRLAAKRGERNGIKVGDADLAHLLGPERRGKRFGGPIRRPSFPDTSMRLAGFPVTMIFLAVVLLP